MSQSPRCASNVRVSRAARERSLQHRRLLVREPAVGADDAELHGGGRGDRSHPEAACAVEEGARALAVGGLERERRARRRLRIEVDQQRPLARKRERAGDVDAVVVLPTPPLRLTTAMTCTSGP